MIDIISSDKKMFSGISQNLLDFLIELTKNDEEFSQIFANYSRYGSNHYELTSKSVKDLLIFFRNNFGKVQSEVSLDNGKLFEIYELYALLRYCVLKDLEISFEYN